MYNQCLIKQYGLQRSGTNYIKALLEINYDVRVLSNLYGNKHEKFNIKDSFLKNYNPLEDDNVVTDLSTEEIKYYHNQIQKNYLKFIVIFRDPYSWCVSYSEYNKILNDKHNLSISTDLDQVETLKEYINIWNNLNNNWFTELLEHRASVSFGIYYNNLLEHKPKIVSNIAEKFDLKPITKYFTNINNSMLMGADTYGKKNMSKNRFVKRDINLTTYQIDLINSFLDLQLFDKIQNL